MKPLALILCIIVAAPAWAMPHNPKVRAAFQREHPCPVNGRKRGACPGMVVDHKMALCVGGRDTVDNMAWMGVLAAKQKDRWECKPGWESKLRYCEANGCFVE